MIIVSAQRRTELWFPICFGFCYVAVVQEWKNFLPAQMPQTLNDFPENIYEGWAATQSALALM